MKFKVKFEGRLSRAIGITYKITDYVNMNEFDREKINLALYKGETESKNAYKSISCLSITEEKTMKYIDLKSQIQKEVNNFPICYAFSDEQFKEALEKLGVTPRELLRVGNGGFIRKTDKAAFSAMMDSTSYKMETALKDRVFMVEAIVYELGNHEFCITHDPADTLDALKLDIENETVEECLNEARKIYLSSNPEG